MSAVGKRRTIPGGFTVVELVISAALLTVVMTFTTKMLFRVNQTWLDIGHQRLAINELSNQLDRLTQLPAHRIDAAIALIEPSPEARRSLFRAELVARRITDDLGDRIMLRLDWQRRYPGRPIELVGWLESGGYQAREIGNKSTTAEDQP